jgi:hypothetical protein
LANGTASTDAVTKSQLDNVNSTLTASTVNLTSAQTISGAKTFTGSITLPAGTVLTKQDNNLEGGELVFQRANNDPLAQDARIDLYGGMMRFLHCNAVQVPASAALTTAVSTTGISKAENGYVKFGNGLIIQWGTLSSSKTITFSSPFTNANSYALVFNNNSTTDGYGRGDKIESKSSTSATVNNLCENPIYWLAIGY